MISIVTILKDNNIEYLKILDKIIFKQTFTNFNEWIIIKNNNNLLIELFNEDKIRFINIDNNIISNEQILLLKNEIKSYIKSEYIIYMDCDNYYFPNFLQYSFNKLKNSNKANLGLTEYYINNNNNIYKCNNLDTIICGINIKINNDEIELLESSYGLIKNINSNNINDNLLLLNNLSTMQLMEKNFISVLIDKDIFKLYYNNNEPELLDYDIVYISDGLSISWDPEDKKLGGSEQAIVNLANEWGICKKVAVYGNFIKDKTFNNVDYINWTKFPFYKKIKNLIIWRRHGITLLLNKIFYADNIIVDFHDNFSYTLIDLNSSQLEKLFNIVTTFNFKSEYHKISFIDFLKLKNINQNYELKYNIIPNGIRVKDFSINKNYIRNPFRFCYCSSYDRGLDIILTKIWPLIFKSEPTAELHVYYGMDYIYDENFKLHFKLLLSQPGVMDHGRQPMEMIIREKYLSTFHIYLNNCIAEIDCISIKESLVTGCIPIISNFGVFKDRHGLQYNWDPNNDELIIQITNDLIKKMYDYDLIENIRNKLHQSNTIIDWDTISKLWLTKMI